MFRFPPAVKLTFHHHCHHLDMTLGVAGPNKTKKLCVWTYACMHIDRHTHPQTGIEGFQFSIQLVYLYIFHIKNLVNFFIKRTSEQQAVLPLQYVTSCYLGFRSIYFQGFDVQDMLTECTFHDDQWMHVLKVRC